MMIFIYALVIAAAVLLDFLTKQAVMRNMEIGESIPLVKGVFNLTYIRNPGAAFGSMAGSRWIFMLLSVVAILVFMIFLFVNSKKLSKTIGFPIAVIIGGGIGNMIDRTFYGSEIGNGEVVDFIDFCAFPNLWMWIFNVADALVCVGVGLLLIFYIRLEIIEAKKPKIEYTEVIADDLSETDSSLLEEETENKDQNEV